MSQHLSCHIFAIKLGGCLLLCAGLSSCVSSLFASKSPKSQLYDINPPPSPWQATDGGGADRAFRYPDDRSTMSVNSVCEQYQNLSLEDLTKQLLVGVESPKMQGQTPVNVHGLAGMESRVTGRLDGKDFDGLYTVLRSSRCVYDLLLIARPGQLAMHTDAYHKVVQSFHEGDTP